MSLPWSRSLCANHLQWLKWFLSSQTKQVQDFALLPITLTGNSIHPGVSGISRLDGGNPLLGPQSPQQNSNSVNRFRLCLNLLLGSMALSGTGTLVASLVSKIIASTAMAKAGGAVSGTILAGSQGK